MINKKYLLFVMVLIGFAIIKAQKSIELDFKTPMPPESYQFKKRLINNVSLYTGQPSISIPIYTINLDGLQIPITISYNTGGIKTDEDATMIGLGWSLNIGGEINRTNHGALDENYLMTTPYNLRSNGGAGIGFLKIPPIIGSPYNGYSYQYCDTHIDQQVQEYSNFYHNAYYSSDPLGPYQNFDARPDEFFYSILDHSGKIMFSQKNSRFVPIPFDDIKIDHSIWNSQLGSYTKKNLDFVFTLSNGYKVTFGREGIKAMYKLMTGGKYFDQTWQIGSITSPKGNSISYVYQPVEYTLCTNYFPVKTFVHHGGEFSSEYMKCNEITNIDNLPKIIVFEDGKIQFNYNDRLDLMPGSKRLEEIIVYNSKGDIIKQIKFNQEYFDANFDIYEGNNTVNKRLKLSSIKIIHGVNDNSASNENYTFDYYLSDKVPSKTTEGRDHWGYFNGRAFGSSNSIMNFNPKTRSIHDSYAQVFSLKSIRYPEGGKKEFIYESHQAIPNTKVEKYYDEITDERYSLIDVTSYISGYDLNYFYPEVSDIQLSNYPFGHKVLVGEEFEIKDNDFSLSKNELSLFISSDLPFKHPDYDIINREYNYVSFELQKKNENSYENFLNLGEISKDNNPDGNIEYKLNVNDSENSLNSGFYRIVMIVYQPLLYQYPVNNINHNTIISFKYRRKVKNEGRIGGLRIKKINTYLGESTLPDYVSEYSYLNDNGNSSGKIISVPDYNEIVHVRDPGVDEFGNDINLHNLSIKTSNDPVRSLYKTSGSNVGYTKITKNDVNVITGEKIKESDYFTFQDSYFSDIPTSSLSRDQEPREWQRGKLIRSQYFKNNDIIKENIYEYNGEAIEYEMDEVDEINTDLVDISEFTCNFEPMRSKHIDLYTTWLNFTPSPTMLILYNLYSPTGHIANTYIPYFKIYSGFDKIKTKTTIEYINGIPKLITKENFSYFMNTYKGLEKNTILFPDGTTTETTYQYAHEKGNQYLIDKNIVGIPLQTTVTKNNIGVSSVETKYPISQTDADAKTNGLPLPTSIISYGLQIPGASSSSKTEVTYDKYDDKGNILQYTVKGLQPTVIIWGYNQTQPIVKIEGISYDALMGLSGVSTLVNYAITKSNSDVDTATEQLLLTALDNLRTDSSLNAYMISTYTYDPLIGVTSITPPSGVREIYKYDSANRLQSVVDVNGKILKEYQYNYKQ